MISYLQAITLGAIQGITELFPVSSLGHTVILPTIFGWNIDQSSESFLLFLVATHFATALVLFLFFWKDWKEIIKGFLRSFITRKVRGDTYATLAWLIVVATIPAGILGVLFETKIQNLLGAPIVAAVILVINGIVLLGAEKLRSNFSAPASDADGEISKISWKKSLGIGGAQALALIPGFSRTGSSLSGGLMAGLDHESAARFAFLLATPIIFAAAIFKLPKLLVSGAGYPLGPICLGAIVAACGAYFSTKYLVKYFETKTLKPFAYYCIVFGIIFAALIACGI